MRGSSSIMGRLTVGVAALLLAGGCQFFVDDADREVYRLVEKRQQQAVGTTHDAGIDAERVPIRTGDSAYAFVPHPVDSELPASFKTAAPTGLPDTRPAIQTTDDVESAGTRPADSPADHVGAPEAQGRAADTATSPTDMPITAPASAPATVEDDVTSGRVLTLAEALAYAFDHARDYQSAKEDLYLAALALTLERHLWTPRLVGEIASQYANFGEIRHFDDAMDAVSTVGVEQRLPYGGTVTAQIISTLMRDLTNHVTTGETGQALLEANIPLLKGAGPVAYESRYRAERQLIYAVRTFERFRRSLAVDIAADYFNLQQLRQEIINATESIEGFDQLARRARAFWKVGKSTILDVQRAEQDQLRATNARINAIERYQTAADLFKIRIGMPTETRVTVELARSVAATQPAAPSGPAGEDESQTLIDVLAMPLVDEAEAVRVALKHRLDLLNDLDRIGDAQRGVVIAENGLLPALDAFASVRFSTDPGKLGMFEYEHDRATWRTGLNLELPLDRKAERNALRESLILKRRAERDYQEAKDTVTQQVRRAMRRVEQQRQVLRIQVANRHLAQQRLRAAQFRFQKSLAPSLEVVDAQTELLEAQNSLAAAQAAYKVAILEFWRDTDMLRIADDGKWEFALDTPSGLR
ncbi:MAG: TolC family protein [Planctomycetes bacterium]|nr:TolC family protein [Planctomycetota bacterium]